MNKFLNFWARASLKPFLGIIMSKNNEKVFYAVGRGKQAGVYDTWSDCKLQIEGVSNAKFRKFFSLEEAEEFVNFWRNYSSTAKDSDGSQISVSTSIGRTAVSGSGDCQKVNKQTRSKSKDNFILGYRNNEENLNDNPKLCLSPYISPIAPLTDPRLVKNYKKNREDLVNSDSVTPKKQFRERNKFRKSDPKTFDRHLVTAPKEKVSEFKRGKVENDRPSRCSTIPSRRIINSSRYYSSLPNSTFEYSQVFNNGGGLVTSTQNSKSESASTCEKNLTESGLVVSEDVRSIVKEEVIEVDSQREGLKQNENCQVETKSTQNSDNKLSEGLKMIESALTVISDLDSNESERLRNSLKTLLEIVFANTNASINLQMGSPKNVENSCEDSNNHEKDPAPNTKPSSAQDVTGSSHQQYSVPQMSQVQMQSPSPHSSSFEGRAELKNVDVLALNLRLDSFEKRFDACLKEVGAIVSDISHIKSEIKEMREKLQSEHPSSGSSFSPRKPKDGMLQTTLSFGSVDENKALHKSYSTYQEDTDSKGFGSKRKKNLKRKLSRSESSDNSKRVATDEEDHADLLNRIKTEAVDYPSFTLDEDDYVEVYTDGASHCNGKTDAKAGIGIWWGDSHPLNVSEPVVGPPTNNTAEIQAARVAMELAVKSGLKKLKIFTDSEFLINCATRWIHRWKKNGWLLVNGGPVKNRKELEKLDKVAGKISVRWEKVPGHAGVKGNEMADRLANEGASRYKG